ncbi:MAG TPA: ABC transporter ATP-binding protein [Methylomirabilota bacterium]|nr:ABC transporter ATP-binding protein [Methylomirabilota bacterium]
MSASVIAVEDIQVRYGEQTVLDVLALEVLPAEVLAVIGPNGAGKSTLLRVLALLTRPDRGTVRLHGTVPRTEVERLAWRRRMACVFQEPLLCRGSVLYNTRLACRLRGIARPEAERRAHEWLGRLGIGALADRPVDRLSGGEAQRTSLARAFAAMPEVLFLDEPFAALDAPTREALLDDLGRLLAATRTTTVLVTHDRAEALRLGDRVAVVIEGRLAELGPPEQVFGMPGSEAVARFVGVENLLPGRVAAHADGLVEVEVGPVRVTAAGEARPGESVLVGLRPEDLTLAAPEVRGPTSAQNRLSGRIVRVTPLGPLWRVGVECGVPLTALVTRPALTTLALAPGAPVDVTFKATAVHLVRRGASGGP